MPAGSGGSLHGSRIDGVAPEAVAPMFGVLPGSAQAGRVFAVGAEGGPGAADNRCDKKD